MRVALDIDDTITLHPEFFAFLSNALLAAGHGVYIISFREGQEEVEQDLGAYGVAFTRVILPTNEDLAETGFYEWKASVCRSLRIDIFFEDMPEVINELDPSTIAFVPFDRDLGRLTYVDDSDSKQ